MQREKPIFLRMSALPAYEAEAVSSAMNWIDDQWDDAAGFLGYSYKTILEAPPNKEHPTRDTAWYALGLIIRDINNDRDRAIKTLGAVAKTQLNAPGKPYHGTFLRRPDEPVPGPEAKEFTDFDPNCREFIGATFALVLANYERQLPADLVARLSDSLRLAVEGTLARKIAPTYSHIAIMRAFLLVFAGDRLKNAAWVAEGEAFAKKIYSLFKEHGALAEYNSPTCYGVDLFGFGLWRSYTPGENMRKWGAEMEETLWKDIGQFYHAGMRNMAGPFDRSYGMDMTQYAALLGMWIWLAVGRPWAPFPDVRRAFDHAHDFSFMPALVAVGVQIPDSLFPELKQFSGERQVEHALPENRIATAWLGKDLMLGGETGGRRALDEFHPGTVHWRIGHDIGWIRIEPFRPVDARAEKGKLAISLPHAPAGGPVAFNFVIYAPGADKAAFDHEHWQLPGLLVHVEANVSLSEPEKKGSLFVIRCTPPESNPVGVVVLRFTKLDENAKGIAS